METCIKRKHIKGFTLIELLVVISIIAVLMAIMMPALNKVRNQAKKVVCSNNLHQIHVASSTYAADNNGKFPSRGPEYDSFPHLLYYESKQQPNNINLRETLVEPYLAGQGDKILYCSGTLKMFRNADKNTKEYLISYQYFNFEKKSQFWNPGVKQPNLTSIATAKPDSALWSCLTFVEGASMDTGLYTCHDGEDLEKSRFKGSECVRVGGDCGWTDEKDNEAYFRLEVNFLWPKS